MPPDEFIFTSETLVIIIKLVRLVLKPFGEEFDLNIRNR